MDKVSEYFGSIRVKGLVFRFIIHLIKVIQYCLFLIYPYLIFKMKLSKDRKGFISKFKIIFYFDHVKRNQIKNTWNTQLISISVAHLETYRFMKYNSFMKAIKENNVFNYINSKLIKFQVIHL